MKRFAGFTAMMLTLGAALGACSSDNASADLAPQADLQAEDEAATLDIVWDTSDLRQDAPDVCIPNCEGVGGWIRECGDDGCGGLCGSCDDQDPCTIESCSEGACETTISTECCSVDGKMVPPGTPSTQYPCRGCQAGLQQAVWPLLPEGTACGPTDDPSSEEYARCQAGECCRANDSVCWDGQCACEGTHTYGQCESECDMLLHMESDAALCVTSCGGDCCDNDDQCQTEKSRCAPLPRADESLPTPTGRCVIPIPYPSCWVATDCPEGETCVNPPSVDTCPYCNVQCPGLKPGKCTKP